MTLVLFGTAHAPAVPTGYARLGADGGDRVPAAGAAERTDPACRRPHDDLPGRDHGAGGADRRRAAGIGRARGRQRRRQDHAVPPDARADAAHLRRRSRSPAGRWRPIPSASAAASGYMPEHDCLPLDQTAADVVATFGELAGLPGPGGPPAGVRHARPGRARRGPVPARRRVLHRHAPAHQAGPGAGGRSRAGAARRADGRPRPHGPRGDARAGRPPGGLRHLGHPGHPPARRRAAGLRARRDDRRAAGWCSPGPIDQLVQTHGRDAGRGRRAARRRAGAGRRPWRRGASGPGWSTSTPSTSTPASTATTPSTPSATPTADLGLRLYSLSTRHRSLDDVFMQEARR